MVRKSRKEETNMKVLVTGFDPFGGEKVNPAYEAVKLLPDTIAGAEIIKLEIPTVFSKSGPAVEAGIQKYQPDVVINVGQAGGRSCVTIEILRGKPCVLPGSTLYVVLLAMIGIVRIERRPPAAVRHSSTGLKRHRVHVMPVGMASLTEESGIVSLPKILRSISHGTIRYGIFHVVSYGFVVQIRRYEAIFLTQAFPPFGCHRRSFQSSPGKILVEPIEPFHQSVCDDDTARVPYHAVSLVAPKMPHRQAALTLEYS